MKKILKVTKQGKNEILFEQNVPDESIISVGNNPGATLELKDAKIAPEQFVIITEEGSLLLMNRANGTVINGESLELGGRIELHEGDKIEIGDFQLFLTESENNGSKEISEAEEPEISGEDTSIERKDFSAVLNSLKEEDSFYFQIISEGNVSERVIFDTDEIWLGTSFAEIAVKKEKTELDEVLARVKKDWSGAVIYPEDSEEIFLNGEILNEPSRLKNDDELVFVDDFADEEESRMKITFHEPVVLLALNSILPEDLPEPVKLDDSNEEFAGNDSAAAFSEIGQRQQISDGQRISKGKTKRIIFGYFTVSEIIIMAIGTLVTAALIFLVLEFV